MNDLIMFSEDGLELEVRVTPKEDTVWLNLQQMVSLFNSSRTNIVGHIRNIYDEGELEATSTCRKFRQVQNEGSRKVSRLADYYNLDVIISVGYRVKSSRGVLFRKWANKVLKQYLTYGYAINEKRLAALERTVRIESRIIAGVAGIQEEEVFKVIQEYTRSLELLDDYDHQQIKVPAGHIGA